MYGPFLLAQAFGKQMFKRNWGRIVNISSIWSVVTRPGRLSYSTSKIALLGLSKTLAVEWAKSNVLVNSVSPGFTLTELTKTTNPTSKRQMQSKHLARPIHPSRPEMSHPAVALPGGIERFHLSATSYLANR